VVAAEAVAVAVAGLRHHRPPVVAVAVAAVAVAAEAAETPLSPPPAWVGSVQAVHLFSPDQAVTVAAAVSAMHSVPVKAAAVSAMHSVPVKAAAVAAMRSVPVKAAALLHSAQVKVAVKAALVQMVLNLVEA
jgi:hypothetical protein